MCVCVCCAMSEQWNVCSAKLRWVFPLSLCVCMCERGRELWEKVSLFSGCRVFNPYYRFYQSACRSMRCISASRFGLSEMQSRNALYSSMYLTWLFLQFWKTEIRVCGLIVSCGFLACHHKSERCCLVWFESGLGCLSLLCASIRSVRLKWLVLNDPNQSINKYTETHFCCVWVKPWGVDLTLAALRWGLRGGWWITKSS